MVKIERILNIEQRLSNLASRKTEIKLELDRNDSDKILFELVKKT